MANDSRRRHHGAATAAGDGLHWTAAAIYNPIAPVPDSLIIRSIYSDSQGACRVGLCLLGISLSARWWLFGGTEHPTGSVAHSHRPGALHWSLCPCAAHLLPSLDLCAVRPCRSASLVAWQRGFSSRGCAVAAVWGSTGATAAAGSSDHVAPGGHPRYQHGAEGGVVLPDGGADAGGGAAGPEEDG